MNPLGFPTLVSPHGPLSILSMRERSDWIYKNLETRLKTILPAAMREANIDLWLILCQEDHLDPVFQTFLPMNTWCPILQMLIFFDPGKRQAIEGINLSFTDTRDLYQRPWKGRRDEEQWALLRKIVEERDPRRIGINTGATQWAAGGLTRNLYQQLIRHLSDPYVERLVSAEDAATHWLSTMTEGELDRFEHVVKVARQLLRECYTAEAIEPNVTTKTDLEWRYWQHCTQLGFEMAFKPYFFIIRSASRIKEFGEEDEVLRPGDFIRSDVGIRYLRLNSDHQQWAYIRRAGESDVPEAMTRLMAQGNRLQDIFMAEFKAGLSGNELLSNILQRARAKGLPNPKVYSHSLGLYLHQPGPLIGLPWEQECCPGRGDVILKENSCFTVELSVTDTLDEWEGQPFTLALEENVAFTREGCRILDDRQETFFLI